MPLKLDALRLLRVLPKQERIDQFGSPIFFVLQVSKICEDAADLCDGRWTGHYCDGC